MKLNVNIPGIKVRTGEANRSFEFIDADWGTYSTPLQFAGYSSYTVFFVKTAGSTEMFEPVYQATPQNTRAGTNPHNSNLPIVTSETLLEVLTN